MTQIGSAYAQGLYALAKEENIAKELLEQLQVLNNSFVEEPGFLRLLSAPNLPKEERCGILDNTLRDKVHPYILNFLKILTEKGYTRHFADSCKAYEEQYNADNGILAVRAVTAVALTDLQKQKLINKLSTMTGKTIALTNRVDPRCLGGIRLDYDGKCIDGTVQNRLDSIRSLLKNTVL